jgi:SAM-dependent methyltransferase
MCNTLEIMSDMETVNATNSADGHHETCPLCGGGQVARLLVAPDRFHLRKEMYRLDRCSSCTGVWLASPPKPEEMGRHYTADYHTGIMAAGEGPVARRWKYPRTRIDQYKQGGAILDIGCSSGGFLSTMKGAAWELYGIEMEKATAERAKANTGASIFVGDAVTAPFLPETFDVITSFDLLEHVYFPRQFLTKVLEWLKPGGIYYAIMPNIDSWEAKLFGTHWYGLELPRHLFHFSPHSLRCLMTELGFEEVCVKTPRVSYMRRSVGYVFSSLLEKVGLTATPQARPKPRNLPRRAFNKAVQLAIAEPFAQIAAIAGSGPSVEVVFRKPTRSPGSNGLSHL